MSEAQSYFSGDYFEARERFRARAERCKLTVESHPIDAPGPGGEQLSIDVALGGPAEARRALIVSSGLHGVEGPVGSAIQLALLDQLAARGDDHLVVGGTPARLLLIHALNPYGFAWRRRTNEDNIDPNRNFLLEGEQFAGCPELYPELNELLNPNRPPSAFELFFAKAVWQVSQYGMTALKEAIARGQYEFPEGLFYGGQRPCQTQTILQQHFARWLENATRAVHVDIHTNLGRWTSQHILLDRVVDAARLEDLRARLGENIHPPDAVGPAYSVRGSLGTWCAAQLRDCEYFYVCVEYGTYGPLTILKALRAENQAHHWCSANDPRNGQAKQRLSELSCPPSDEWREKIVQQGTQLLQAALEELAR